MLHTNTTAVDRFGRKKLQVSLSPSEGEASLTFLPPCTENAPHAFLPPSKGKGSMISGLRLVQAGQARGFGAKAYASGVLKNAILPAASLLLAAGCTHSDPVRVEQDYGNSVRHMINAQIYNPEAAEHPIIDPPRTLDGPKGEAVIESYRSDVAKPEVGALPAPVISIGD